MRRHFFKRAASTACAAVVLAVLTPAAPASAASCYGLGCEGKDPNYTGCASDARDLQAVTVRNSNGTAVGKVQLRYSPACRASWSRVESFSGPRYLTAALDRYNGGQGIHHKSGASKTVMYTSMVWMADGRAYRAVGHLYYSSSGKWTGRTEYFGFNWI